MGIFNPAIQLMGAQSRSVTPFGASLAGVALVHVAALALVATFVPAERILELAEPLTMRLIELVPKTPVPPPKPPEHPKPKPIPLAKPISQPILTATPPVTPSLASFAVPPQPSVPSRPAVAAEPILAAPPAPISPPRFDADYLRNPKPAYPVSSRRLGEEGKVVLRVQVTPDGQVAEIEIKASSGFPRLDAAARNAVTQWRFVPARRGEESVAASVLVPIVFSLEG